MVGKSDKRAIVFGSKGVNATGLIRSLGCAGVYVTFASKYHCIESKYVQEYVKLPDNSCEWLDILQKNVKESNNKHFIYPTDDESALWIDKNYEKLKKNFIIPNAEGKLRRIADKSVMNEMAKETGLDVPDFFKLSLDEYESNVIFPVILKPYAGYAGDKGDISICKNKQEYISSIEKLKSIGYSEVIVQQLIDDPNQEEIGLLGSSFPSGEVVIPGIIHKIRSYPTGRGSTSFARFSSDLEDINVDKIKKFVASTGYVGLFDIEMIKSEGKYWFLEINYRNGQYGYTPTVAGYNLPKNWMLGMLGIQVEQPQNLKEVFYINERDDFRHVKNGEISLKEWIRQFRLCSAYGMFCPGDQRPFVRQYIKIPDRIITKWNHMKEHIKDLLIKEEWSIAIRKTGKNYLWENNGDKDAFHILNNSFRYWAADPFVVSKGNKDYLFFEMFDRFKSKGLIGCREIENGLVGKMKVVYEAPFHLSFPFIFKNNNEYYMMPEYSEGENLPVLKAKKFPDKWEVVCNWMEGKRLVDSVLLKYKEQTYLFTQEMEEGYSFNSLDIYLKKEDGWIKHELNPVIKGSSNSRLGGGICILKNQMLRVAQDCEKEYGRQLHFNRITQLSVTDYKEELVKTIDVDQLNLDSKNKYYGIHTYNFNKNYEVIDLKNTKKFKFANLINLFYRLFYKLIKCLGK